MKNGYKMGLGILLLLIIAIFAAYVYSHFFYNPHKTSGFSVVVDKVKGYTLDERDSKLMKNKFEELKKVLNSKEIDFNVYSSLIAQLYIIDLYDIDSKVNKYDVPCLEYIFPEEKDKFKLMIKNEFYSKLEDNSNEDRKQTLPSISNIKVDNVEESNIKLHEKEYKSYVVMLSWEYKKDLGYDKKAEVILAVDSDKVYVVKHTPIVD